jgi:outer membrane murein-binding lipoprotein Lpp
VTLTIFVAVVAYVLLLAIIVGTSAGTAHHLYALGEHVRHLSMSVDKLSARVDEARHATQVVPQQIIKAHQRSYQRAP